MFPRLAETELQRWYLKSHRKPLILRGARQVGKSTLVRQFAKNQALHLYEINLEKHVSLNGRFQTLNLPLILHELEGILGEKIQTQKTLLFLDEIQATPWALAALRYFYEERPDLAVIAAGSLLEFTLADHSFSMPVGRIEYLHLGPLTFSEYLIARGESYLDETIKNHLLENSFARTAHERLCTLLREFLVVGGMPEAVALFAEKKDFLSVRDVQNSILSTYQSDFSKYASKVEINRLQTIFSKIPAHIGQRIKYSTLLREDRATSVRAAIDLLALARVVTPVFHSACNGIPLAAGIDEKIFKLIFLDVGLVCRSLGLDGAQILRTPDARLINEGPLAEQLIGQELHQLFQESGRSCLIYWLREGKLGNAEVDYVVSSGTHLVPIEVKSGKRGTLRSLHQFVSQKKPRLGVRFWLNPPAIESLGEKISLISLPLYWAGELPRICEQTLAD